MKIMRHIMLHNTPVIVNTNALQRRVGPTGGWVSEAGRPSRGGVTYHPFLASDHPAERAHSPPAVSPYFTDIREVDDLQLQVEHKLEPDSGI